MAYAFFDVDDTLISVKSMFSFQNYWYKLTGNCQEEQQFVDDMARMKSEGEDWAAMNTRYYEYFSGRSVAAVEAAGRDWLCALEANNRALYHTPIVAQLNKLNSQNVVPVFVSGSFQAVIRPLAERLGVEHLLVIQQDQINGIFTGKITPPQTIGVGKAIAIDLFLAEHNCDHQKCYAFGDDISDLPMLEAVGHPHVVAGGRGLDMVGRQRGWPILSPHSSSFF